MTLEEKIAFIKLGYKFAKDNAGVEISDTEGWCSCQPSIDWDWTDREFNKFLEELAKKNT